MSMLSDIFRFFKALSKDMSNLLDPYPKRSFRRESKQEENENWTLKELGQAYEPWNFLSDEQWQEILRGEKPLEDYTTSHSWPPDKGEIEALAVKQETQAESMDQENAQEQSKDSEDSELSEPNDSIDSEMNSVDSSPDISADDSGNYDGYIG